MEKMNKSLITVLKKMCNIVNADFNKIDFKKDRWYHEYSWTEKEEKNFRKWLSKFIYDNKKAREDLTHCRKNQKDIKIFVNIFLFNYGWKTKD